MPRNARYAPGGLIYHVINRGVGRQQLFFDEDDYLAFEKIISETLEKQSMRILSYCLMPNHWHFVMWPKDDGDLGRFMQRLTVTHVTRWQKYHDRVGEGHVYQGRFKSFPVESDEHFYRLVRYVERNPLRANLVRRAENWQWSGLWIRQYGDRDHRRLLSPWPIPRSRHWLEYVNEAETEEELAALRNSVRRGAPYGTDGWVKRTSKLLGLESTLRNRGRPRKP